MVQRLTGARLESIACDGDWSFTEKQFILQSDNKTLPPDLLKSLLGPDRSASRIEGNWRLEDDNSVLALSDVRGDGKEGLKEVRLEIVPAGPRVNIGGPHQYNIVPGKS
jgi:hypothetical protein